MSGETIDIKLHGRSLSIACPPEERAELLAAVALLDAKMAEIAQRTRSSGERLALMTALNLAHELTAKTTTATGPTVDTPDSRRRIRALEARLDEILSLQEDLF